MFFFLSFFAHFVVSLADDHCDEDSFLQLQEKLDRNQVNFSASPYIVHFNEATLLQTDSRNASHHAEFPVVMMHGMGDYGKNPRGMIYLQELVAHALGTYVHNMELCSNPSQLSDCPWEDQQNGFFMTLERQVDQFARVVRADPKLSRGFNVVAYSQGNTVTGEVDKLMEREPATFLEVVRGYIHKYNDPPVKKWLSIHGVLMGVNGFPECPITSPLCGIVNSIIGFGVYSSFVQDRLAQANYYRDAANLEEYKASCRFMPYINNEVQGPGNQSAVYRANFEKLEKVILVKAEEDTMITPRESEHFGYFKDGSRSELVAMRDAPWYTQNWFGLKTLDEAQKIDFYSTPGGHLHFTKEFLEEMVLRYFL